MHPSSPLLASKPLSRCCALRLQGRRGAGLRGRLRGVTGESESESDEAEPLPLPLALPPSSRLRFFFLSPLPSLPFLPFFSFFFLSFLSCWIVSNAQASTLGIDKTS